ncbi:MAG: GNAT family N-acetyltransferase [Pseudomonadota bacterium]
MRVRAYRADDARVLPQILHAAVHATGSAGYSSAQRDAWSPAPLTAAAYQARVDAGRTVFTAVDDADHPVAFIELERDGRIDCFYCHPDAARAGVGGLLYDRLERKAVAAGLARLYVEASEAARRFFLQRGFVTAGRREFERRGVLIHNYAMEKLLG